MLRRALSIVAYLGSGSRRKRLYVRLGAAGVLLAASVWAIAQAQKLTRHRSELAKADAAQGQTAPPARKPPAAKPRIPQPIPSQEQAEGPPVPPASLARDGSASSFGDPRAYDEDSGDTVSTSRTRTGPSGESHGGDADEAYAAESQPPDAPGDGSRYGAGSEFGDSVAVEQLDGSGVADDANPASSAHQDALAPVPSDEANRLAETAPHADERMPGNGQRDDTAYADALTRDRQPTSLPDTLPARPIAGAALAAATAVAAQEQDDTGPPADSKAGDVEPNTPPTGGGATVALGDDGSSQDEAAAARPSTAPAPRGAWNETAAVPVTPLPARQSIAAAPGPPELEGIQTPSLAIEKVAPPEVQVGREATFEIHVRNVGQVTAADVVVMDRVPDGTKLVNTAPAAQTADGVLLWKLGALQPGAEAMISFSIIPQVVGDIGSVAHVSFTAQATARSVSTKPEVRLEVDIEPRVLIGDSVAVVITISNDGTGAARGLVLEEDVPAGLSHPAGHELENELGTIEPGQSRRIELALTAEQAGDFTNLVRVRDDADLVLTQETAIEVVAPQVQVSIQGPELRYLEREATYDVAVQNVGTATASNVEVVLFLPRGLQYLSASKLGQYDPSQHAVHWSLQELPPQQAGSVQVQTLPIEAGKWEFRIEGRADLSEAHRADHTVDIVSVAKMQFAINDTADPIEVGSDTEYEVEIANRGTNADTNVVVVATLPPELTPVHGEGPSEATIRGQQVQFAPIPQIAPGERLLFRIQAQGQAPGDAVVVVQARSDTVPKPVSKEESTKVYQDSASRR